MNFIKSFIFSRHSYSSLNCSLDMYSIIVSLTSTFISFYTLQKQFPSQVIKKLTSRSRFEIGRLGMILETAAGDWRRRWRLGSWGMEMTFET